ncbi:MAG: pilus assembly protein [Alphaproteobacteria bacterium]|nr:pilus assembly protein [Alphaproteobacteria bacterium]MBF0128480.1 pilus assembly protein [Alphaproteobacteria bacterium]
MGPVPARKKSFLRAFRRDSHGSAAVEFALVLPILCYMIMNVADLSIYIYKRMEVDYAAQMGAQAAWKTCDETEELPATVNCGDLETAVTAAVGGTSLGDEVSLVAGSLEEAYYCVNDAGALELVSDVSTKPSDCTDAGMPSLQPGDYISLQVTYDYTPLFPGITITGMTTVGGMIESPIVQSAFMRLD